MPTYHAPRNEQMMDEIYIALSVDENGEGIVSMHIDETHFPMVFGHKHMIDLLIPTLKQMVKDTGRSIKVFKFKKGELLQEFTANH